MDITESLDLSDSPKVQELLSVIMENVRELAALASDSNRDSNSLGGTSI